MDNRDWDEGLKDMLGDYKPEGLKPDWDDFSSYMAVHEQMDQLEEEAFDENLKESVSAYEAPLQTQGWEMIESSLNLADQQFDQQVRDRINKFEPNYNPHTWTLFLRRFTGLGYLRTKLIAFKVVEVAAVLLLLLTVVKMGQMGKLPFETPLFENGDHPSKQTIHKADMADHSSSPQDVESQNQNSNPTGSAHSPSLASVIPADTYASDAGDANTVSSNELSSETENERIADQRKAISLASITSAIIHSVNASLPSWMENGVHPATEKNIGSIPPSGEYLAMNEHADMYADGAATDFMATNLSPVEWNHDKKLPKLNYVKQPSRAYTEFGIVSQLDYNRLRMPEDRLYSAGKHIIFPQQGIPSSGFGGGFSFAIGHPRWAVETGIVYSSKNFKPGRQLFVGDATDDNGSVEFEAMRLQLISVPLNFRYRIDNKGVFKVYGLTGMGFHMIAQSDIDVSIKYHFPSLSFGEDPNKHPELAETIRETRRISEHIRDGAPFSTKSFFSINTGAGIEYSITEHKTLFLQSAIQYQIPNLKFSNNNGKHIRSVSMQMGVRTPFGR